MRWTAATPLTSWPAAIRSHTSRSRSSARGVRRVVETTHSLAAVVVAHLADEQRHSPVDLLVEAGEHLRDVEGRLADVDQAYGGVGHTTTLRGSPGRRLAAAAYRGPMSNTPGDDPDEGQNPFKGTPFEQFFSGAAGGLGGLGAVWVRAWAGWT